MATTKQTPSARAPIAIFVGSGAASGQPKDKRISNENTTIWLGSMYLYNMVGQINLDP